VLAGCVIDDDTEPLSFIDGVPTESVGFKVGPGGPF